MSRQGGCCCGEHQVPEGQPEVGIHAHLGENGVSNAIQFLESLGASASIPGGADYATAVAALDVEPAQREALLGRDVSSLARLLDGRPAMFCMILAPDEGKEDEAQDQQDEQTEGDEGHGEKE